MVKHYWILLALLLGFVGCVEAQQRLPSVVLRNASGKQINVDTLHKAGQLTLVVVWRSCCQDGYQLLEDILTQADEWNAKLKLSYCAISVDDSRSSLRVVNELKTLGWDFQLLLDNNQEFKRQMNINSMPCLLLLNEHGNVLLKKEGYAETLVDMISDEILKEKDN